MTGEQVLSIGEQGEVLNAFSITIQREMHNLTPHPELLWQQMYNRLQWDGGRTDEILSAQFDERSIRPRQLWFHNHQRLRESSAFLFQIRGHRDIVTGCAFSPDGLILASTSVDKTVRLWDALSGNELAVLQGHTDIVWDCAFSPDGNTLATAGFDSKVRLWDVDRRAVKAVLTGHQGRVNACAFSSNGRLILSASEDTTLRIWEAASGRHLRTLRGHAATKSFWKSPTTGEVKDGAFSPDGHWVVSCGEDRSLRLWCVDRGELVLTEDDHSMVVNACTFSPDGRWILFARDYATVQVVSDLSGKRRERVVRRHNSRVDALAVSPDGRWMASADESGMIKVWDLDSDRETAALVGHNSGVTALAISPDGARLASAGMDHTIRVWQAHTDGQTQQPSRPHKAFISGCAFGPTGKASVSASWDRTLKLWDAATDQALKVFSEHSGFITACDFSPDGRWLVSAGTDQTLLLWELRSGSKLMLYEGHRGPVYTCAFSPDGAMIVSGGEDGLVRLWDPQKEHCIVTLKGHNGPVYACRFHPDGRRILSASDDETLRLWDWAAEREVRCMPIRSGGVLAISPSGEWVLSAAGKLAVRLWMLDHPEDSMTLTGHKDWVRDAAFSADARLLFTVSTDKSLRVWQSDSGICLGVFTLPINLFSVAAHPCLPEVICGDALGYLWRVTLKGLSLRALLMTGTASEKGLNLRCPRCGKDFTMPEDVRGQSADCQHCSQPLQVNFFTRQPSSEWAKKVRQHGKK